MKLRFLNTKGAVFILAAMIVNVEPVLAGMITLVGVTNNSCSYTAYGADANGNLTVTCSVGPALPTIVPICTLVASPSTISAGATSTLTVSCSPAANSYVWTGAGTSSFAAGGTVTPTATTTYSVVGSNGSGAGNPALAIVTVATSPVLPPPNPKKPPTAQSSLAEIRAWIYAFETLNGIPHNLKAEPVAYMGYFKTLQAANPTRFHLPTTW